VTVVLFSLLSADLFVVVEDGGCPGQVELTVFGWLKRAEVPAGPLGWLDDVGTCAQVPRIGTDCGRSRFGRRVVGSVEGSGVGVDGPTTLVDEVMVKVADQHQVVDVGRTAA